jgi:hypothetical protein
MRKETEVPGANAWTYLGSNGKCKCNGNGKCKSECENIGRGKRKCGNQCGDPSLRSRMTALETNNGSGVKQAATASNDKSSCRFLMG